MTAPALSTASAAALWPHVCDRCNNPFDSTDPHRTVCPACSHAAIRAGYDPEAHL